MGVNHNRMTEPLFLKLTVDTDFKRLIYPLSEERLCSLEQEIAREGCLAPLSVWHNTILDGHSRYEICQRLQVSFSIQRINLKSREEAIVWICVNQLARQDLTEEMRKYLIGKRYEMEKIIGAHHVAGINPSAKKDPLINHLPDKSFGLTASRSRERLAKEYNISQSTVINYEQYSRTLDALLAVSPELPARILSGDARISQNNIAYLSKFIGSEVASLKQLVSENIHVLSNGAEIRRLFPPKQLNPLLIVPAVSIKDMPPYDPDAEISSLTLTIPSWASSINRVRTAANFNTTTIQAREKLIKELAGLKQTIDSILAAVKEGS